MSQDDKFRRKVENSISGVRAISPQAISKGNQPTASSSAQVNKPYSSSKDKSISKGQ